MKATQKIGATLLVVLLGVTGYGLYQTSRPSGTPLVPGGAKEAPNPSQAQVVDQTPLLHAQRLAQLATDDDEKALAQEALRLSDHEVDMAFAQALRDAADHPPVLSPEAKAIQAKLQQAEQALAADKAQVDQLTAGAAKATGDKKDEIEDELEVAKAQLELDKDEVEDSQQDLIRAGGNPQARIQQMVEQHDATAHNTPSVSPAASPDQPGLINRLQRWSDLRQKIAQLSLAKSDAEGAVARISGRHNALETQLANKKGNTTGSDGQGRVTRATRTKEEAKAIVQATKQESTDQKALATFDKRIDDLKQLTGVYDKWSDVVSGKQRGVLNRVLTGLAIIFSILLVGLFFNGWLESLLSKLPLDRRQGDSLRTVTSVTVQVISVLFILLVIFGPPSQLGTFLGLAGAGLTVALKDFIVSFIGWFVLMGKNGIRLGDWVEINGVSGEVVELGTFHTVLLETGNWTDSGHPTGRRVTFTNSFAIEGHYFNFSTSGQWLWDELQVVLPSGQDPHPIIDAIQKRVVQATAESAKQAEQEWRRAARSGDLRTLSAAPAISVKPVIGGVEIGVRYVTRANERSQLRSKVYQAAVDLLEEKRAATRP
jgi:small-conductance mechanosensitive channel